MSGSLFVVLSVKSSGSQKGALKKISWISVSLSASPDLLLIKSRYLQGSQLKKRGFNDLPKIIL